MPLLYIGLSCLPDVNRSRRRELLGAESRRMLRLLDGEHPVSVGSNGRPFYPDQHADFSISHSGNMAALALLPNSHCGGGVTNAPLVGCDIQQCLHRYSFAEISRRFFHTVEQQYVGAGEGQARRFCQLWVLKEAYLKMKGLSVFEMAQAPLFRIGGGNGAITGRVEMPDSSLQAAFYLDQVKAAPAEMYMLAAVWECSAPDAAVTPEIRWFS